MSDDDKEFAEAVISRLCNGAQIDGIRFGPVLQILITDHQSGKAPIDGQVYLNLGSRWSLVDDVPDPMPTSEEQFPELSAEQEISKLCSIREQVIRWTRLGTEAPHLLFGLECGKVFCLNGSHDTYEPWQLGIARGNSDETWLVVACPGNELAVWAPPSFQPGPAA